MIFVGIILILIGLSALTGISLFNFLFAIILIVIGIRLIVGRSWNGAWDWHWHHHDDVNDRSYYSHHHATVSDDDWINEVLVFSPINKSFTSQNLKGGRIVMVFSGGAVDLSRVKTSATEIDIELSSVFSDLKVIVPTDWKVRSAAAAFAGNVDTYRAQGGDGPVTLTIRGQAVFGNIEVRK
ncbi:MAG TPA: LiaF domain-containing protein [Candidatus Paceibacterota bacterium]|nr:LiaF domain-containing protein [Candidatus Paceibacterota bacterium]